MNKIKQKGYAILFTVVLVSIISLITIGLSNTIYKQLLISSGAKDSQLAFFQSDMATECALYADFHNSGEILGNLNNFNCGIDGNSASVSLKPTLVNNTYTITKADDIDSNPCFEMKIIKTINSNKENTQVFASGYNICNKTGIRAVERTIEVNY